MTPDEYAEARQRYFNELLDWLAREEWSDTRRSSIRQERAAKSAAEPVAVAVAAKRAARNGT